MNIIEQGGVLLIDYPLSLCVAETGKNMKRLEMESVRKELKDYENENLNLYKRIFYPSYREFANWIKEKEVIKEYKLPIYVVDIDSLQRYFPSLRHCLLQDSQNINNVMLCYTTETLERVFFIFPSMAVRKYECVSLDELLKKYKIKK
ncbi:MAG: hypothetical protein QXL82_00010 [Candidatus Aenigmatarchaeota archaeon]